MSSCLSALLTRLIYEIRSLCRLHGLRHGTNHFNGMGMSTETKTNDGMYTSIVLPLVTISDVSDTMENRDKAREIYIKQRELFHQEELDNKEEAAKDKAWMREKAGLPAQTQKT